jgi:hypothetical protein
MADLVQVTKKLDRIKKVLYSLIMKLYLIAHETDLFGTWSTPEQAVREHFAYEIKNRGLNVDEQVKKMLNPRSDYPVFIELQAGKKFTMDR